MASVEPTSSAEKGWGPTGKPVVRLASQISEMRPFTTTDIATNDWLRVKRKIADVATWKRPAPKKKAPNNQYSPK